MFISLFTSLTILPALMTLMPLKPGPRDGPDPQDSAAATSGGNPVGRLIERHGRGFAIAGFVAGLIALSAVLIGLVVARSVFEFDPFGG